MAAFSIRIADKLNVQLEEIGRLNHWTKNTVVQILLQQAADRWLAENKQKEKK